MKRKLGIFALAAVLLMTLAACKSIEDKDPDPSDSSSPSTQDSGPSAQDSGSSDTPAPITDPDTGSSQTDITTSDTAQTEELTSTPPVTDPINMENGIVQTAEALIGIPFAENGTTPADGFDNSGFIYYVLRENGFINCPRLTPDQAEMGTHIAYDELKSGDLAFFSNSDSGSPDFGGIYIGDGQMIYSPMPGQTVKIADITSEYWTSSFVTGVSLS